MNKIPLIAAGCAMLMLVSVGPAAANVVLDWNDEVLNATRLSRNPPPVAALHMATFHVAIFDTVNSFTRTHRSWINHDPAPGGASMDAAIASASVTVLKALWGEASNPRNFEIAYEKALAPIPAGQAKDDGIAWGRRIAGLVLAERAKCGLDKPLPGPFGSGEPGKWRETPAGFRPAVLPHIARVQPFVMTSPDQFRCPPPPAVGSKQHADEIAEVARIGARDGAERTDDQTLTTPFWADDLGTATPVGHWNVIAQDLARRNKLSVPECARLFALLNMAGADAGISCWDTKFFYSTWRPETALREITKEINPHATPMADFIPNMGSPAHPDYTSGHSTFSGATSRLLERWFGTDEIEFTTTSDGLPGAVRTFRKLSDARLEVGMSRVWGGIHTMSANLAGQEAGMQIADWVFENSLQPTKSSTNR